MQVTLVEKELYFIHRTQKKKIRKPIFPGIAHNPFLNPTTHSFWERVVGSRVKVVFYALLSLNGADDGN